MMLQFETELFNSFTIYENFGKNFQILRQTKREAGCIYEAPFDRLII